MPVTHSQLLAMTHKCCCMDDSSHTDVLYADRAKLGAPSQVSGDMDEGLVAMRLFCSLFMPHSCSMAWYVFGMQLYPIALP